ncbi:hypothetical protein [Cupriavidus pinatubonensis]|uniref:hypothetical protein n=1 Tax=Cupriavidus pinatubonensis TaxID=248026 RepID=UPI00112C34AA|nr:hypothetical protein [Cupriavidus pinatubonensis]TPQ43133.1 hypothetical protein C2U69_03715 [Cupriavidus pinatubonensis]
MNVLTYLSTNATTVTAIKDAILALAGVTTALVAVVGLNSWRRELHGKTEYETARNLIRTTYKLREAFDDARQPLVMGGEFPSGYIKANDELENAKAWAYVFHARWAPIAQVLDEFDIAALEAEALWADPIRNKAKELRSTLRVLRVAMEAYIANEQSGGEDFRSDRDFARQIRSEVFAPRDSHDNALSQRFRTAVEGIESEVRPKLKRR